MQKNNGNSEKLYLMKAGHGNRVCNGFCIYIVFSKYKNKFQHNMILGIQSGVISSISYFSAVS